jgi:Flp pilus assembly protein TadB
MASRRTSEFRRAEHSCDYIIASSPCPLDEPWHTMCKQLQQAPNAVQRRSKQMLMTIFAVLLVLWLLGFTVFHVASGLIHLLLILAVISLVVHFVRGRRIA